jgi:hypothetical protein
MEQLGFGRQMTQATPSTLDDELAAQGTGSDSLIAHISPKEAAMLRQAGGSGSINPRTGLMEFYDGGDGAGEGEAGDPGGTGGGDNGNGPGSGVGGDMGGYEGGFGGFVFGGVDVGGGYSFTGIGEQALGTSAQSMNEEAAANNAADPNVGMGLGSFNFYENAGPAPEGVGVSGDIGGPMGPIGSIPEGLRTALARAEVNPLGLMEDIAMGIPPSLAMSFLGLPGYAVASGLQGKGKQAGAATGATIGGVIGGPIGSLAGLGLGYGIGSLAENFGFSEPSAETAAAEMAGGTGEGSEGGGSLPDLATPIVSNRTQVANANTTAQSEWSPDMQAMWDRIAAQGGGNLDKLFKMQMGAFNA